MIPSAFPFPMLSFDKKFIRVYYFTVYIKRAGKIHKEIIIMLSEFKKFALKGNVLDLAVGVIIGGAFGKIVTSLVNDIIMPILGLLVGGINFSALEYVLSTRGEEPVVLRYGQFIQTTFDFFVIAFSIFIFIKAISYFKKKEEVKQQTPPAPSNEEILLEEIRDILKQK